jgi:hypothetical protein
MPSLVRPVAGDMPGLLRLAAGRLPGAPVQQPDRDAERGRREQHEQAGFGGLEGPEPAGRLVKDEIS